MYLPFANFGMEKNPFKSVTAPAIIELSNFRTLIFSKLIGSPFDLS
jgi:hypothetical protein